MRLHRLLEALKNPYGTAHLMPTEPIMLPIPVDEGQSVDSALDALLKHSGYGGDDKAKVRERLIDAVNGLPVVKQSPNGQNARTGKDALPILAWFLGIWNGAVGTIEHDLEQVSDLVVAKNGMKSTRGKWLDDLQRRYPTVDKFRAYIQRERENPANKVEDETVEGYDYPNPFYSDAKVDVYKASTISDAIKYSKGYTFCIGRRDGSNLFYGYRIAADAPESTVYFCWFKGPHGEKTHDNMCVIHVSSNGKYRMTNAGNTNGSPVVDKETVLREYPALRGVLDKMYSEPLDDEERVVSSVRPFTVIELNDTTKGYTRKQIAMLIGNACRFGDDYFEWVYETLDGGELESGDSLIRKYLATGANRPTEEQEERLVRDGWGEYVDYNLKQYTKQVNEAQNHLLTELKNAGLITEVTRKGKVWYKAKNIELKLYSPLDKPLLLDESSICFKGDLWNDDTLSKFEIDHTLGDRTPTFIFNSCNRLRVIDYSKSVLYVNFRVYDCNNLKSVKAIEAPYVWIVGCNNVDEVAMHVTASCNIVKNKAIRNFESFKNLIARTLYLHELNNLTSLKGIKRYLSEEIGGTTTLEIKDCPSLSDVSELSEVTDKKYLRFEIKECRGISKEDFIKYIVPVQKNPNPSIKRTDKYLKNEFISDNGQYPKQLNREPENAVYTGYVINYVRPLDKPVKVSYCKLWQDESLNDLSGIASCDTLDIKDQYGLTDLRPIANIKGVKRIMLHNCPNLISLEGCPNGITRLDIYDCNNLHDFEYYPDFIEDFNYDGIRIPQLPTIETETINVGFRKFRDGDISGVYCKNLRLTSQNYIYSPEPFKDFPIGVKRLELFNGIAFRSFKGFTPDNVPREIYLQDTDIDNLNQLPLEDIFRVMDMTYPGGRNRLCAVTITYSEELDDELQERYYEWAKKQHKRG